MKRGVTIIALLWLVMAGHGAEDPFADLATAAPVPAPAPVPPWWGDNLLLRREVFLFWVVDNDTMSDKHDFMSRYSLGFELQKRFATATRTVAAFDYQGRVVYRNHQRATPADGMGAMARHWEYETHNAYLDIYGLYGAPGRVNLRLGRFYAPFGLNQQSDTHGSLLQLSNERVFGTDQEWQALLYGALSDDFDYFVGYLAGAGPNERLRGQTGMAVARLALGNRALFEHGLEGGLSFAYGERVESHTVRHSPSLYHATRGDTVLSGWRAGCDARQRFDTAWGPFTILAELAAGADEHDTVLSSLAQADWLHPRRRWGAALQYRNFRQDVGRGGGDYRDERATALLTHYFRNDVGNANLHWVAVGVERCLRGSGPGDEDTLALVQYYRYW